MNSKQYQKKVLILIPDLRGGGAERAAVNLANKFNSKRYSITLMTLFDCGVNKNLLNESVEYKYWLPFRIRGLWRLMKFIPAEILHKIVINTNYDIEIAYLEGIATKIVSGGNPRIPKICWLHCEFKHNEIYFLELYKSRDEFVKTYKKFDTIVGVSKEVIKSFNNLLPNEVNKCIMPNIYDLQKIDLLKNEPVLDFHVASDVINFVSIGRLVDQKGYDQLLHIFSKLTKKYPFINLYIFGDGPNKETMENFIKNNKLTNVKLMGYINNPYKYLKLMDCFICSSKYEGYSTAVVESIVVGVPFITTPCSGANDLVNLGGGLLTDGSENSLLNTVELFIQNENLRKHLKNDINNAKNKFDSNHSINKYIELFDRTLQC